MNEYFRGKVALVTSSAAGIGLARAEAFAQAGTVTVMADIRKPGEQAGQWIAEGYQAVANKKKAFSTARLPCRRSSAVRRLRRV